MDKYVSLATASELYIKRYTKKYAFKLRLHFNNGSHRFPPNQIYQHLKVNSCIVIEHFLHFVAINWSLILLT